MQLRRLPSAILLATLLSACTSQSTAPVRTDCRASEYLPLATGNVWHYGGSVLDSTGRRLVDSDFVETDTVVGDTVIAGQERYAILRGPWDTLELEPTSQCDVQAQDRCSCGTWWPYAAFGAGTVGFALSASRVDSFPIVDSSGGPRKSYDTTLHRMFFLGTEQVTTPAGGFSALHFRDTMTATLTQGFSFGPEYADLMVTDRYFAAGVGLVRETTWGTNTYSGFVRATDRRLRSFALR